MQVYTEVLEPTKTSPDTAIRFTPAEADYEPVAGTLVVESRRASAEYLVTEFPCGWLGRGFLLEKVSGGTDGDESSYSVFCSAHGPEGDSCDCKGATRWGTCKHKAAIRSLLTNGWL